MEKVKLPKEVAEAIEYFRSIGYMNRAIIDEINDPTKNSSGRAIESYVNEFDDNFDIVLQALINGYEVEKDPDELAAELIKDWELKSQINEDNRFGQRVYGAKCMLQIFNIKIPGVNLE